MKQCVPTLFCFHNRLRSGDVPAGITVSRSETLPVGDFTATEYCWGSVSLWFVDSDKFTKDERQKAYQAFSCMPKKRKAKR